MAWDNQAHADDDCEVTVAERKFFFFVDNAKYDHDSSSITGAGIRQKVPNLDPAYSLFLEAQGDDPDRLVQDTESFDLERKGQGPLKFYSVPPAAFGNGHY
jgi:hypothetical protein